MAAEEISVMSALRPVLDAADQIYVAVRAKGGPHVTPELLSVAGDHIICMAASSTLKVKRARADSIAAFAAFGAGGWCSAVARIEVLDPLDPRTALSSPGLVAGAPMAVAGYLRTNALELSGVAVDFVRGRLGVLPPHRVLIALTPLAVSTADGEGRIDHRGWDSVDPLHLHGPDLTGPAGTDLEAPDFEAAGQEVPDLEELGPLADLVVGGPAVLGWLRADGTPLALPVQWDAERHCASLPSALFEACGAGPSSPACVTFDGWSGLGPSGKQGVMLRGTGFSERAGESTTVSLAANRVTTWDGVVTRTLPLA